MMEAHRERRLRELFDAAVSQPPHLRSHYLAQACGADHELREKIEALLLCAEGEENLLGTPLLTDHGKQLLTRTLEGGSHEPLPESIGQYRIVGKIGAGSMGTVYEAVQSVPRRTVAIKVLRPGASTEPMLRRFEFEAHILGRLNHRFIARVFDAGVTDSGRGPQPFFAMELVKGSPLTQYAKQQRLSARKRLELLANVCDAVHYAHTQGVIHRDLKPDNILVDEHGLPRILDFGVARVMDDDAEHSTHATMVGQLVGSLRYMSPEQARGQPGQLDTRSDIYALGVMAYESLAGRPPYLVENKALPEAARTIVEIEPTRLGLLDKALRGDVETIIAKALEKDKDRRYQSASDLADDIRRHLRDEPIVVRPPTVTYQLGKYARRHKGLCGGLAAALALLFLGVAGTSYGLVHARAQQRLAEVRLAEAEAARKETDEANAKLDRGMRSVLRVLGEAASLLTDARLHDTALKLAEDSVEICESNLGKNDPITLATMTSLAPFYEDRGDLARAEHLHLTVLERRHATLGPDAPATLDSLTYLAALYEARGNYAKAEPHRTELHRTCRRIYPADAPETLIATDALTSLYLRAGCFTKAESLITRTLDRRRAAYGSDDQRTQTTAAGLALLYMHQGRHREAEPLLVQSVDNLYGSLGETHPRTWGAMNNLASLYLRQGRYDLADPLLARTLELRSAFLGPDHPDTLVSQNDLAVLRQARGDLEQAERLYTETLEARHRALGAVHPDTIATMANLAGLYMKLGRCEKAEHLLLIALDTQRRVLGELHPHTLTSMNNLACVFKTLGRHDEAESLFADTLEAQRRLLGDDHPHTLVSLSNLGDLYRMLGQYDEAEPALASAVDAARCSLPPRHPHTAEFLRRHAVLLTALHRFEQSERLLLQAYDIYTTTLGSDHRNTVKTARNLVTLYITWNKTDEAARWRATFASPNQR